MVSNLAVGVAAMRWSLTLALIALLIVALAACTQPDATRTAIPTPTATAIQPTLTPAPTPTVTAVPSPTPPVSVDFLATTRERLASLDSFHMEVAQKVHRGDVAMRPWRVNVDVKRPEGMHGIVELGENSQEFLRLGEDDYIAETYRRNFSPGRYRDPSEPWPALVERVLGYIAD
jgi:hypothetical protein